MNKKRRVSQRIKVSSASVRVQNTDLSFLKKLKCVQFTGFENGSVIATGTIPKTKSK
jgi:hypothetical protein